jgi:Fe-S-cluster containining protein
MARSPALPRWQRSPERAELLALYAEADTLLAGWSCACSAAAKPGELLQVRCCQFAVTGREPYPTAVELAEVRHAMRIAGIEPSSAPSHGSHKRPGGPGSARAPRAARKLPMADLRPCPLLSEAGRCRIYASRPLGCRTFFCQEAERPYGARLRPPRDEANAIGRRIADLSARFDPRDPHPRALTKSLA